jgi:2'-5' RNA ligase
MAPNWFVGLPVAAGPWLAPLVADAPRALRVFHREDLHLTVAFLGACGEERALAAWRTLDGFDHDAVEVSLGGLVPMGNPRRYSALSVLLVSGGAQTAALIGAVREPMWAAAAARPDDRPPQPHLTVARPTRAASAAERRAALAWATGKPPVGAHVLIDRIALYTWSDDRQLRQFRIFVERPLGRAAS